MTTPAQIDWTRTAPAPLAAWIADLKVGDKVAVVDSVGLLVGDPDSSFEVKTIVKITPSGQICTEAGNGQRFLPSQDYVSKGVTLAPLLEEEPAEAVVNFTTASAPNEGTITLSASPVRMTELEGKLVVQSDYNADFVAFAKSKKGRFSEGVVEGRTVKVWSFELAHKDALAKTLTEIYGADGLSDQIRTVDVRLELDKLPYRVKSWWYLGREIAKRGGYDWSVKAPGVKVIKGDWTRTGGTRSQPRVDAEDGTVIEVRGVPLALALREGEARGWDGISLVTRTEDEQIAPTAPLQAPAKLVADAGLELPALTNPYGGSVPVNITVRRQEDLQGLDEAFSALCDWSAAISASDLVPQEAEGLLEICAALGSIREELRALLSAQRYDFWSRRALQQQSHGVDMAAQLLEWGQYALGLDGPESAHKTEAPVIAMIAKALAALPTPAPQPALDLPVLASGQHPPYLDLVARRRRVLRGLDAHRYTWRATARPDWSKDAAWSAAADQLELCWEQLPAVLLEQDSDTWREIGRSSRDLDLDICAWVAAAAGLKTTSGGISREAQRVGASLATLWTQDVERTDEVEQAAPSEQSAAPAPALPAGHLALDTLRLDERTQLRAARSAATLDEYASRMALDEESGQVVDPAMRPWPAVVVYRDAQGVQWVADGHHRVEAAQRAGLTSIQVEVAEGELRDAVMYAASANTRHGLRLTTADKRRAITAVLSYPEGWEMSDRAVAALCGASHPTVAAVKRELRPELYERAEEASAPAPVEVVEQAARVEDLLDEREEGEERDQVERVEREEQAEPIEEEAGPVRDLLPALIPFGQLDSAPVEAHQVRALRTYLGLSMTRFGELLGSSRQRVAVWEEQGTQTAHPPVNALIRLYLASILPGKESAPATPAQPSAPAEAASDEPDPGAPGVEEARGVEGFGWRRQGASLRYRTPYKVEIAKALQTTPGAVWDGHAWGLPATPESVELIQGLVRRHWGVELGEQLLAHRVEGVSRGAKGEPGELIQLAAPGSKAHPDGLWGRVIASNTWRETDDGWIDQYVLDLYLERATPADDPDVAEQLAAHKAKLAEQAAQLAQWEERQAAGAARAEEIRQEWTAQGLRRLEPGERLAPSVPVGEYTRLHRWDLSADGRLWALLEERRFEVEGREQQLGREWAHVAFDDDRSETWAPPELIVAAPPVEIKPLTVPLSTSVWVETQTEPGPPVGQVLLVEAHVYGPPHKRWVAATVTGIGKTIWMGAEAASALGREPGWSRTLWLRPPSQAELATLSPEDRARLGRRTDDLDAPARPQQMAPVAVADHELPAPPKRVTVWTQARGGKGGGEVGETILHPVGQHWLALTVLKRGRPTYHSAEDSGSVGPLMDGGWSIVLDVRAATAEEIKTLGDKARLVGTQRT